MEEGGSRKEDGGWRKGDGGRRMEDGERRVEDGGRRMEKGGGRMEDGGWYLHRALQQLSLTLPLKAPSFTVQSLLSDLWKVAHHRREGFQCLSLHTCSAIV